MRTDGRTDGRQRDMTKLIVVFHNFANAPENIKSIYIYIKTFSVWYLKEISKRNPLEIGTRGPGATPRCLACCCCYLAIEFHKRSCSA